MEPEHPPIARRITQDDVARKAGVTRSVVSYVLNGNSRAVAAETRDRVLQAITELGYRPNQAAQSLGLGRESPRALRQIGIVLPSVEVFLRPYYTEILAGVHLQAHESSYHVRFIRFFDELHDPIVFNSLITDEAVEGLVLIALDQALDTAEDRTLLAQMEDRIGNIVCVEWQREGLPSVFFDRQEAAAKATGHLLGLGHREIGYIGESDQRVLGFHQAIQAAGLPQPAATLVEPGADMRSGFESAERLLAAHPKVTALVAGSDEVAIGVLRSLAKKEIPVPGQIALASIDNLAMAEFATPPLTTVNVQKAAMGRRAVQMIIDRNRRSPGWTSDGPFTMLLPTTLIIRESSGSPRS
jgi:LacI family transcriptional regulator